MPGIDKAPALRAVAAAFLVAVSAVAQTPDPPAGDLLFARLDSAALSPDNREALKKYLSGHDYAAAEEMLAKEASTHPKTGSLLPLLADFLFLDGKQLNAIVVLKKAELLGPLDEHSRFLLALSYISLGRRNLAIPELESLVRLNPSDARYPYWLSRVFYRKANWERALFFARLAIHLDPAFAKAYDQLGLCYVSLGENENAIRSYETAIRLNKNQRLRWQWPALNLGALYLRLDRLAEAADALSQSLAAEPEFPAAHFRLGQVFEKEGHIEQAIEELRKSAALDATYPEPHYALARIYQRQKDTLAAKREMSLFARLREQDNRKGTIRPD